MKTLPLLCAAAYLGTCSTALAIPKESTDETLEIIAGLRSDDLQWNIAGPNQFGQTVNILSELTWRDVRSLFIGAAVSNSLQDPIGVKLGFEYGEIFDGKVQDSDYNGDNRTQEFNRSYSDVDDSETVDLHFAVGPNLKFGADKGIVLRPAIGYSYHAQALMMWDLKNVHPIAYNVSGPVATYDTSWQGPFLGADLFARLSHRVRLLGALEFHYGQYDAKANWALRSDFQHPVSFRHQANSARGEVVRLGVEFLARRGWIYNLNLAYSDWDSGGGTDTTYFIDGSSGEVPFNGAQWTRYELRAAIKRDF